jgi:acyl-coenzyme A thioesterase PaaI-like protein
VDSRPPPPLRPVTPEERARREALLTLAEATRRLSDAVAITGVGPSVLEEAETSVRRATRALGAAQLGGPYSHLMDGVDYEHPSLTLPLSPIIGAYSPVRPEVELWLEGDRVRGRARLERKHTGPPGAVHGGVVALIADQLMAVVPWTLQVATTATKTLTVRYRRPVPLYVDVDLEASGETIEKGVRAVGAMSAGGVVCVEVEAELVIVTFSREGPQSNRDVAG